MLRSLPPLMTVLKASSAWRHQTLSVCTANVCTHRCWPRSHSRMVWSLDPDRHMVPCRLNTSALHHVGFLSGHKLLPREAWAMRRRPLIHV